jgi:hypothetical protein
MAVALHPNGESKGKGASGSVDVVGFPSIEGGAWGDVAWQVDGSSVTGKLLGKDGQLLGHFEGTMSATGVSGKFTHADGRVGLWSWDGPPPAGPP